MRLFYCLFLTVITGVAVLLAYENQRQVNLTIWNVNFTTSLPVLVGLAYLAGMLSGWSLVGLVRRSISRVLQEPLPGEYARAR